MEKLIKWLEEQRQQIKNEQDNLPAVFDDIEDGYYFYYCEGFLTAIKEIKYFIEGAKK